MEFKEATDRLAELNIMQEDVAEALGVTQSTVAKARMDAESSPHTRPAPAGWQAAVAKLARARAAELAKLADQLERGR